VAQEEYGYLLKPEDQIQIESETEASVEPEEDLEFYIGLILKEMEDLLERVKRG
jgi:hypothetical protein